MYSLRQVLPLLSLTETAACQAVLNHGDDWWKCAGIRPDTRRLVLALRLTLTATAEVC